MFNFITGFVFGAVFATIYDVNKIWNAVKSKMDEVGSEFRKDDTLLKDKKSSSSSNTTKKE